MLVGEYKHTIDIKKRLAIPAKFRKELGKRVVVTRGLDNCLFLYSDQEWQILSEKLSKLPMSQSEARGFVRLMLAGADLLNLDSLGRILIPEYLKKYAGLKKQIVIIGVGSRLEIWDEEKWENYKQRVETTANQMAEKLSEMGI